MHLSPTRYKVTDISICVFTLLYFSVHYVHLLCICFSWSPLQQLCCVWCSQPQEIAIGAGGSMCKGQASNNDKKASYVWILGKSALDSFLKSKCGPSKLLVASLSGMRFQHYRAHAPFVPPFPHSCSWTSINYMNFNTDENKF